MTKEQQSLMKVLDETAQVVATFTGIKAQYVQAGWDPANAELMVIESYRAANRTVS